jgi:hypothetical protein
VWRDDGGHDIKWVQEFFFANMGEAIIDKLSEPAGDMLRELEPHIYYRYSGYDGQGLSVPTDLDRSICAYFNLARRNRDMFDRAAFWLDVASRQWSFSLSASFAAIVSAIEALTERSRTHEFLCPVCRNKGQHDEVGATRRFHDFIEDYAPGIALKKQRALIYGLRSGVLHGSELLLLDQDVGRGWDPP